MKVKFRFSGRGGQGIKFLGSALVRVAMVAKYHATLSVDYTPSVRGGPIFCDVVLSTKPISYPYCDEDADFFVAIDQKGFERATECVSENTVSFIDANSIDSSAEEIIKKGMIHRVPITKRADENKLTGSVNILSLGFLSEHLKKTGTPDLKEDQYIQVFNNMRNSEANIRTFHIGRDLYHEIFSEAA
ncbi:MAG: 2-oxoacid:acceptor oxidoreductase family protein [Candidatus Heimdallarchaeota archaeon]|nr:MAG: 2-oxoacid:acceptor oxidoreductase family protein [Candidatus Heimdallarchaeota archaeon]